MLAFVYVMLSAKPVSLRRLCALFVLSTAAGAIILGILHVPHSSTTAVHVASAITFTAWVLPLIRIVRTMRRRAALSEMLSLVSIPVQLTYWSSLLLAPIVMVAGLSTRLYADGMSLGAVSRAVTVMLNRHTAAIDGYRSLAEAPPHEPEPGSQDFHFVKRALRLGTGWLRLFATRRP